VGTDVSVGVGVLSNGEGGAEVSMLLVGTDVGKDEGTEVSLELCVLTGVLVGIDVGKDEDTEVSLEPCVLSGVGDGELEPCVLSGVGDGEEISCSWLSPIAHRFSPRPKYFHLIRCLFVDYQQLHLFSALNKSSAKTY
jgi:hypothetical protein